MADVLVDASFLVALGYARDRNNVKAEAFARTHAADMLIPDVVLVEAMYNLQRLGGMTAALTFSRLLINQAPQFIALTIVDFTRAMVVMEQYRDAELDFVDCCLMALAERLRITRICTFDRRDFSMVRPLHTNHFELLP
jgi:uncharacterized protein